MHQVRMMAPADGPFGITINGRRYEIAPGVPLDVPAEDAGTLEACGWILSGGPGVYVGTPAERPADPANGDQFIDTAIGAVIEWDGHTWRDAVTGARFDH